MLKAATAFAARRVVRRRTLPALGAPSRTLLDGTVVPRKTSYKVLVTPGEEVSYCSCGRSERQPFAGEQCDAGSHGRA